MPPARIRIAAASNRKRSRRPIAAVRKKRAASLKTRSVAPKPARSVPPPLKKKMLAAPPPRSVAPVASVQNATPRVATRAALRPAPAPTAFLATVGLLHADPEAPCACVPMPIVRVVRVDRVQAVPAALPVRAAQAAHRVQVDFQAIVRAVRVAPAHVAPAADRARLPRSIPMI